MSHLNKARLKKSAIASKSGSRLTGISGDYIGFDFLIVCKVILRSYDARRYGFSVKTVIHLLRHFTV